MGLFGNILSSLLPSLGRVAGVGYEIYKDQHLTGAQREANQFSSEQASLNRGFQSQQAELTRDWQEEQYLKYNSPAAMMSQYRDAGLNPALMYQQGTSPASMSSSVPSGDSASSVAPSGGDLVGMLGKIMELSLLGEQKRSLELKNQNQQIENDIRGEFGRALAEGQVNQLHQAAKLAAEQAKSEESKRALQIAQKILAENQSKVTSLSMFEQEWRNAYIKDTGASPDRDAMTQLFESTVTAIGNIASKLFPDSFTLNLNSLTLPTK